MTKFERGFLFSAVVVANIVSWIIISIIGWFIFFVVLDSFNDELIERLSTTGEVEFPTISVPSYSPPALTSEEIDAKQDREERLAVERRRATRKAEQRRSAIAGSKEMACSRYRNLLN